MSKSATVFVLRRTDPTDGKVTKVGSWTKRSTAERHERMQRRYFPLADISITEEERDLAEGAVTIRVTKSSLDAYQRAAEGFEQQAHRAHVLLHDFWEHHLTEDPILGGELHDGLNQYREQYGADWPETCDGLEERLSEQES